MGMFRQFGFFFEREACGPHPQGGVGGVSVLEGLQFTEEDGHLPLNTENGLIHQVVEGGQGRIPLPKNSDIAGIHPSERDHHNQKSALLLTQHELKRRSRRNQVLSFKKQNQQCRMIAGAGREVLICPRTTEGIPPTEVQWVDHGPLDLYHKPVDLVHRSSIRISKLCTETGPLCSPVIENRRPGQGLLEAPVDINCLVHKALQPPESLTRLL